MDRTDTRPAFLLLLCLANLLAMADRALFGAVAPLVGARFGLSDTALGLLLGPAVAVTYAVGAVLLGPLADRGLARRLVLWGLIGHAIAGVAMAASGGFAGLLGGRVLLGASQAALIPAALVLIVGRGRSEPRALSWFTAASALGRGVGLFTAGALLATIAWAGLAPTAGGWRVLLALTTIPALLLAVGCRRALPDQAPPNPTRDAVAWRTALVLWPLFVAAIGPVLIGQTLAAWLPTVLVRHDAMPAAEAAALVGGVLVVAAPAAQLIGGAAVARVAWLPRHPLAANVACLTLASFSLLFATEAAPPVAIGLAVGATALFAGIAAFVTIDAVQRQCAPVQRGAVTGVFLSTVTLVGTGGGPLLAGLMSDAGTGNDALGRALALLGIGSALLSAAAALGARVGDGKGASA